MHVPQKIKAFGWRCFIERLPTRDALVYRGILPNTSDISCVFCRDVPESMYHSLFLCHVADLVRKEVTGWIDFVDFEAVNLLDSFVRWSRFCKSKRVKKR